MRRRTITRILIALLGLFICLYTAVIGYFMWIETSIVYHPAKNIRAAPTNEDVPFTMVSIPSSNSVQLSSWIVPPVDKALANGYWILFLHGNAGNVSTSRVWYRAFREIGFYTLALDYRGYGASQGTPSEQGVYSDAQAAFDYLVEKQKIPADKILVYGHSLGASVAIDLALARHPAAIVIEGGLLSVPARGQELYPFLPVTLIARNRFDSASKISAVTVPKLFLHATHDTVAPIDHGKRLFDLALPPKRFVELKGDHGDAIRVDRETIATALQSLVVQRLAASP